MYINNLGHMTKMAAMPIYGKNPSKIIISETNRLISRKLGVRHRWLKYSNVYINHDPVMTLTKFMARSTWVACASELGKLLKCHLKEKANRKLANGQNIEDSEKRKWPKGLSAPALELNTIIFKHVYWYMQLISGERLQDHWSSGLLCSMEYTVLNVKFSIMQTFIKNFGYKWMAFCNNLIELHWTIHKEAICVKTDFQNLSGDACHPNNRFDQSDSSLVTHAQKTNFCTQFIHWRLLTIICLVDRLVLH